MCAPDSLLPPATTSDGGMTKSSSSSSVPFTEQTISMSAGRFMSMMVAVALGVFVATAQFYTERSYEPSVYHDHAVEEVSPATRRTMVPLNFLPGGANRPNQTSRTVLVKSGGGGAAADKRSFGRASTSSSSSSVVSSSEVSAVQGDDDRAINVNVGSLASEVGLVIVLQAIFPVLNRVIMVAKRVRWASLGVRVSPAVGRLLKVFGDVWHTLMLAYKKTSASKIITRTKKMVKIFKHHDDDDHHDDHDDDHHDDSKHKKDKKKHAHRH